MRRGGACARCSSTSNDIREVCQPVAHSFEIASVADRSSAEHLAQLVEDAVRDGRLDRGPAQLFYATRILGERQDAVAPVAGLSR
ncbi:MAG TPA: hypothetical protein VK988_02190 [Acidimicrobiales bacterium]|nr:hypothetical protein [Acidimicrobiales bacterium]